MPILSKYAFKYIRFFMGVEINVLAISRAVKSTLSFNNPYLAIYGNKIVGIKSFLFSRVILIYERKILTAFVTVFIYPFDTMVEKSGKKFELCSKLYDHASHNGYNYLNRHCMVSILLLSFPVLQDGKLLYLSVPLGYHLWDKETSKLALPAGLPVLRKPGMKSVSRYRQIFTAKPGV